VCFLTAGRVINLRATAAAMVVVRNSGSAASEIDGVDEKYMRAITRPRSPKAQRTYRTAKLIGIGMGGVS
jgi:hypothetical protein